MPWGRSALAVTVDLGSALEVSLHCQCGCLVQSRHTRARSQPGTRHEWPVSTSLDIPAHVWRHPRIDFDDLLGAARGRPTATAIYGSRSEAGICENTVAFGSRGARPIHVDGAVATSSVHTRKLSRVLGPNVVAIATSVASRPRAISTRPMRGTLFRGSNVCHAPPR